MPRQIFKNKTIATAGPLPGQLTPQNIQRWTELRKGRFSESFDPNVTHLLCTKEQFTKRVPRVKDALKRGPRFHILHYDWFEFSAAQERRLPEREYSMRGVLVKENAAKRELARVEKGRRDGEKFVNTNYYHIYVDRELFPYQIELTRDDKEEGEFGQKYTLCLWESNAKPHLYWFTAKFLKSRGSSQPKYHRPSAHSGKWRPEMDLFADFFRIKTGVAWEDRVVGMGTMPASYFQYSPPSWGKPVGRRLRFEYEYCRRINAEMRGLAWLPVEEKGSVEEEEMGGGLSTGPEVDETSPMAGGYETDEAEDEAEDDTTMTGEFMAVEEELATVEEDASQDPPVTTPSREPSPADTTCTPVESIPSSPQSPSSSVTTSLGSR